MYYHDMAPLLALDLSLTGTGWAYSNGNSPVEFGVLAPPKKMTGMPRINWIRLQIRQLVTSRKVAAVVFEDLAFNAHDRNHERAGLAMLVRYTLWCAKVQYLLVAPTTLKKFVTGTGKGKKSNIQKEVLKRWSLDTNDDNEADAITLLFILLALAGKYESVAGTELIKAQTEVIKTVREKPHNVIALKRLKF